MDVATALNTAVTALGFAKSAASVAVGATIEAQTRERVNEMLGQVGKAQEALLTIQALLFALQSENNDLKSKVRALEEEIDKSADYELIQTPGKALLMQSRSSPAHYICPACHAGKRQRQILQPYGDQTWVRCPSCGHTYNVAVDPSANEFRARRHNSDWIR